jgi:nitroreductase
MGFLELVKHRKSVRSFLDAPVERDRLLACLEAARLAPSASNSQPWRFIVVDDAKVKKELCDRAFSGIYSVNSFCRTAPVVVVVLSQKSKFLTRIGARLRGTNYYLIDLGIACEHLVLQAEDLGLGSCYIGWFNEQAVKRILNVPRSNKVELLIALGYHDGEKIGTEHNREPIEKIASFNSY